jgi:hypothetical protein
MQWYAALQHIRDKKKSVAGFNSFYRKLMFPSFQPRLSIVTSDNVSVVYMTANPVHHRRVAGFNSFYRNFMFPSLQPRLSIVTSDNVSVVYMTANPVHHRRTKHSEIDIHFIHHVPSSHQFANIMTKGRQVQHSLTSDLVFASVIFPLRLRVGI